MPLSGLAIAEIGVGGVILYSGIQGYTIANTVTWLLKGTTPPKVQAIIQPTYQNTAAGSGGSWSGSGAGAWSAASAPVAGNTGASSASAAQNQSTAKQILNSMGLSSWTSGQTWQDLVSLWNQESGWNANAQNPGSTAYGIAQFLDSTWSGYGPKTSDPATQIRYGIEYIRQRYGTPVMAWAHEVANQWY